MRRLLLALYLLLALAHASAAGLVPAVEARLDKPELLRGRFEQQKSVAGFRKPLLSSGDFLLWREHGVLWHTLKPFESTLAISRNSLSLTAADRGVVTQMDTTNEPGLRLMHDILSALLAGDFARLQKHFRIEGELSGKQDWMLQLTPANAGIAKVITRIHLYGDRHVKLVKIDESNGDSSQIRFTQLVQAPQASNREAALLGY